MWVCIKISWNISFCDLFKRIFNSIVLNWTSIISYLYSFTLLFSLGQLVFHSNFILTLKNVISKRLLKNAQIWQSRIKCEINCSLLTFTSMTVSFMHSFKTLKKRKTFGSERVRKENQCKKISISVNYYQLKVKIWIGKFYLASVVEVPIFFYTKGRRKLLLSSGDTRTHDSSEVKWKFNLITIRIIQGKKYLIFP